MFLREDPDRLLGILVSAHSHDVDSVQRQAWQEEIDLLKQALRRIQGTVYLEFDVPRLASRIDVVVVAGPAIFPVEFKCGEPNYYPDDYNQAWDYALDLKNFHLGSHDAPILPVLVATKANHSDHEWGSAGADGVWAPRRCNGEDLCFVLLQGLEVAKGQTIDGFAWGAAAYHPTPTIIEAARALYSRHSVEAISRNDAGAKNLRITSGAVEEIVDQARERKRKVILFVTGVPGAGKTLVGLNVATRRRAAGEAHAVYLSGNGPLVAVLQEALTRDELARVAKRLRKGEIRQPIKQFIQNVHHFRDEGVRNPAAPFDHVVIFDEAQRAWDKQKTADFMKRRKGLPNFGESESEFLISYLDRHNDWAVVICLVGGGQEIHTGEAGIAAWLDAVRLRFYHWQVHVSPDLTDSEYAATRALDAFADDSRIIRDPRLHLSTSMRSFRSENVSSFVKAVLDRDSKEAQRQLENMSSKYPIGVTRDLVRAKRWIREHARGSERYGLVASSQAQRLKPHAIDVRVSVDPVQWFLNDRTDTRSSYYLEDAATEFQIQGLELDWICVTWDADLRLQGDSWAHHEFRGKRWIEMRKSDRKRNLLNAYRVLLTRARQGMVIFIPPGDHSDPTRHPRFYDETFNYLSAIGIPQV